MKRIHSTLVLKPSSCIMKHFLRYKVDFTIKQSTVKGKEHIWNTFQVEKERKLPLPETNHEMVQTKQETRNTNDNNINGSNVKPIIMDTNVNSSSPIKITLMAPMKQEPHMSLKKSFTQLIHRIQYVFLPKDYPKSVTKEYLNYSIYSFIQSVTGTMTGTMATQALLQALGASASLSIALSATTNWIIKDGVGLLGGVLYASIVSNKFDSHPKRYRFLSNVLIQLATMIELLTPLFPSLFLPMASLSNIGKNVGWLASSATRAAMHNGFTKHENLGDLTAKAGVQGTAAGLVGTGLGVTMSFVVGTSPIELWSAFIPLCGINLWSSYMSSGCVVTRSLNKERFEMMIEEWTRHVTSHRQLSLNSMDSTKFYIKKDGDNKIKTPEQVSAHERFIRKYISPFSVPLHIDVPLQSIIEKYPTELVKCFERPSSNHYRIMIIQDNQKHCEYQQQSSSQDTLNETITSFPSSSAVHYDKSINHNQFQIYLWFTDEAQSLDTLKGFYHACLIRSMLSQPQLTLSDSSHHSSPSSTFNDTTSSSLSNCEFLSAIYTQTKDMAETTFPMTMIVAKSKGWQLEYPFIQEEASRIFIESSMDK